VVTQLEGEIVKNGENYSEAIPTGAKAGAIVRAGANQVVSFSPLAAEPVVFKNQLISRQENYDQLASFMREMLIPDKDFGRIHHANKDKCPKPWACSYKREPYHWSDNSLWAPGADKVLAMLGLEATYTGYQDYIRAAVTGKQISDVIMTCHVLASAENKIAEGMGAATRGDHRGDLNNTLKIACKRARVDAVLRLPGISALFEDDFLAQVARDAARKKGGNSTSARQRKPKTGQYNTGAHLTHCPIGTRGKMLDKAFAEMDERELTWLLKNITDKPDIRNAAKREWDKRFAPAPEVKPNTPKSGGPDSAPVQQRESPRGTVTPDSPAPAPNKQSTTEWVSEFDGAGAGVVDFKDLEDAEEWKNEKGT